MATKTHIIAMANQKGGCGKTTSAVNLAAGLAVDGYNVTLVDIDPQCNATASFGIDSVALAEQGNSTIANAYLSKKSADHLQINFPTKDGDRFDNRLTVVCGHGGLRAVKPRLEAEIYARIAKGEMGELDQDDMKSEQRQRLRKSLDSLRGEKDFVIIDTPPDLDFLQATALIAADSYILPMFPSGYDVKGLEDLLRAVQQVKKRYNERLHLLGVLIGRFDQRTKLDEDVKNLLIKKFSRDLVFETTISGGVRLREATFSGLTIFEHAPKEQAAQQFLKFAREVVNAAGVRQADEAISDRPVQRPEPVASRPARSETLEDVGNV